MFKLAKPINSLELSEAINLQHKGDPCNINVIGNINDPAALNTLYFNTANINYSSGIVIAPSESTILHGVHLCSDTPRRDFVKALNILEQRCGFAFDGALDIHDSVVLGENSVIGKRVHIGEGTVIGANVVISDGVNIGKNCVIMSGAVIGEEGFGYERLENNELLRFPHLGSVIIEDNVRIGNNCTVCKGTLGNTLICDGAKIDNLVHISHNVQIGKNAVVIACAELSGSVVVNENAWVGPNSAVREKLTVGASSMVGIGAVVVKDVPEKHVVFGNPAKVNGPAKRS